MSSLWRRFVRADWPTRLAPRTLAVLLLAIVVPTLVLLYLGLETVRRQQDAIARLEEVTARLTAEQIVRTIETDVTGLAASCLGDRQIAGAVQATRDWSVPGEAQRVRGALDAACRAHRLCRNLVVLTGTNSVPRLDDPLPTWDDRAPEHDAPGEEALREGERQVGAGRPALAAAAYERALAGASSAQVRAVALSRLGALRLEAGQQVAAVAMWEALAREYGDTYDRAHRPQALIAALHLQRAAPALPSPHQVRIAGLVAAARRDLLDGRWVVSPAQADYFLQRLGGTRSLPARDARLSRQFELAQGLSSHLQAAGMPRPGAMRPFTLSGEGDESIQAFASTVPSAAGPVVVAMSVDLAWVREQVVSLVARRTASGVVARIGPAGAGTVAFRQVFPFWTLHLTRSAGAGWGPRARGLAFGGAIGGVLAVLVVGVTLIVRDASREATTARMRADLMNGVSHELRTPLTVIRLYAESLAEDFAAGDPKAAQSRVILHESQRLGHLVERVLEFSRAEGRHVVVEPELHDPSRLVQEFAARYRPYLTHLGFDLVLDVLPEPPPIAVDAGALTQALVNLVDNAVKYAGESPCLHLRVSRVGASVAIDVEDQGPGIDPAERPRVVEPYYRGGATDDRRGHGLGLHLVAGIMLAHGGRIEFDDVQGGGTRVRLLFPARNDGEGE